MFLSPFEEKNKQNKTNGVAFSLYRNSFHKSFELYELGKKGYTKTHTKNETEIKRELVRTQVITHLRGISSRERSWEMDLEDAQERRTPKISNISWMSRILFTAEKRGKRQRHILWLSRQGTAFGRRSAADRAHYGRYFRTKIGKNPLKSRKLSNSSFRYAFGTRTVTVSLPFRSGTEKRNRLRTDLF